MSRPAHGPLRAQCGSVMSYHWTVAVGHWSRHEAVKGVRGIHYAKVAWLFAVASQLAKTPHDDRIRGHLAHSRIVEVIGDEMAPKHSREIAKFWESVGAIKCCGSDARGTTYELILPPLSELDASAQERLSSLHACDPLVVPRERDDDDERPRKRKAKSNTPSQVDIEKARTLALESMMPTVDAKRRRSMFADALCGAARLPAGSIRYAYDRRSGSRADEVGHAIDFCAEHSISWENFQRICGFVGGDPQAPEDVRWLFAPRMRDYLASVFERLRSAAVAPAPEPEPVPAREPTPEELENERFAEALFTVPVHRPAASMPTQRTPDAEERPRLWQRLRALGVQGLRAGDLEGVIEQRFGGEDQAHAELDAYLAAEDRSAHPLHELLGKHVFWVPPELRESFDKHRAEYSITEISNEDLLDILLTAAPKDSVRQ